MVFAVLLAGQVFQVSQRFILFVYGVIGFGLEEFGLQVVGVVREVCVDQSYAKFGFVGFECC